MPSILNQCYFQKLLKMSIYMYGEHVTDLPLSDKFRHFIIKF